MEGKWSSLPSDILGLIAQRLIADELDMLHLRAVCSSWRVSVLPTGNSPFQISFIKPIENDPINCYSGLTLSLKQKTKFPVYLTQKTLLLISPLDNDASADSAAPWIIQVIETDPKKLLIFYSFSSVIFPKHEHPDHINLLDYKITVIHRSYHLQLYRSASSSRFINLRVRKTILVVADGSIKADDGFAMFALVHDGRIVYWRSESKEWIYITEIDHCACDMVRFKDKIYAVKGFLEMITIDLVTCKVENAPCPNQSMWTVGQCKLAEFNGHLYLVTYKIVLEGDKKPIKVIENLCACVLNEENECWDRKYDLDGGVFIVFEDSMLSVLAKDFGLLRSNFIFFDRLFRLKYNQKIRCHKRNGCSVLYDLQSGENIIYNWWPNRAPFWPPPNWFKEANKTLQLLNKRQKVEILTSQ